MRSQKNVRIWFEFSKRFWKIFVFFYSDTLQSVKTSKCKNYKCKKKDFWLKIAYLIKKISEKCRSEELKILHFRIKTFYICTYSARLFKISRKWWSKKKIQGNNKMLRFDWSNFHHCICRGLIVIHRLIPDIFHQVGNYCSHTQSCKYQRRIKAQIISFVGEKRKGKISLYTYLLSLQLLWLSG